MTRKGYKIHKRIVPDPKFKNETVSAFINRLMLNGKKSVAMSIVYDAMDLAEGRLKRPGIEIFEQALRNVSPTLEVRSEEHTSELQSRLHLVCRLLLEK